MSKSQESFDIARSRSDPDLIARMDRAIEANCTEVRPGEYALFAGGIVMPVNPEYARRVSLAMEAIQAGEPIAEIITRHGGIVFREAEEELRKIQAEAEATEKRKNDWAFRREQW